jgi:signal transduction histidine kinase/ActR/RegA family two-component response regulator
MASIGPEVAGHLSIDRESWMWQLLESLPVGVFVTDSSGAPYYVNRAAQRLLGRGVVPDAAPGDLSVAYQVYVAGTDELYPTERLPVVRALAGEPSTANDIEIRQPGGTIQIEATGAPILDDEGNVAYAVAVFDDISDRRRAEEAARQAREHAEHADLAKSDFLSRMSHELRTPLNAILGFGQLLEMDDLSPDQRESTEHILKAGRHLLDLINEVLDISRIESGRMAMSIEPVGIAALVDEATALVRPMAAQLDIRLEIEGPRSTAGYVVADRQRLKQVVLNLLSNAVKYNRPGGSASLSWEEVPGDRLRITVADTGTGINEARMDALFEPFDRLGAEQTEVEGTGLGLALSKRLVQAMSGTIALESSGPQGSVFVVELPLGTDPTEQHEAAWEAIPDSPPAGRPRTLLYIEDNLDNLKLVQRILSRRPEVTIIPAIQGELGLQLAREHRPDMILLDLHLPDVSGEEILRRLVDEPETRGIPVIVVSADATPHRAQRLLKVGARAFLTKPFDVRRFVQVLDEMLGQGG